MEQFYPETTDRCKLISASPESVNFILSYSRSLKVIRAEGLEFESTLN